MGLKVLWTFNRKRKVGLFKPALYLIESRLKTNRGGFPKEKVSVGPS